MSLRIRLTLIIASLMTLLVVADSVRRLYDAHDDAVAEMESVARLAHALLPSALSPPPVGVSAEALLASQDVEIIGWLYQFYISEKKDQVFAGLKKNQKITSTRGMERTRLTYPPATQASGFTDDSRIMASRVPSTRPPAMASTVTCRVNASPSKISTCHER